MEVTLTKTYKFDLDMEAEIARIKKAFKGKIKKDLLAMIDAFLVKDFEKMEEIYDNLPCEDGYPGQEYVGLWYVYLYNPKVIPSTRLEF